MDDSARTPQEAEKSGNKPILRDERGRIVAGSGALHPGGRPKGGGPLARRWRALVERPPPPEYLETAANTLGCDPGDLARFETIGDLMAHVVACRALAGGVDFLREIGDRIDPKPRRVEVSGPGGVPLRGAVSGAQSDAERDEAARYFDDLDGRGEVIDVDPLD